MMTSRDYSAFNQIFISDGLEPQVAKNRYRQRREWLYDRLDAPLLVVGPTAGPSGTYPWVHIHRTIYQDPYLLYLSGVNQVNTAILIDPRHRKTTLFLPKKNPAKEFWEGIQLGSVDPDAMRDTIDVTGIDAVADRADLTSCVRREMGDGIRLNLVWNTANGRRKHDATWSDLRPIVTQLRRNKPTLVLQNASTLMWEQRLVMDNTDIANLRIANHKSADAYLRLLSQLRRCASEHDAASILDGSVLAHSEFGNSFPSIVANGKNAAILHYTTNNAPIVENALLLTDFGVRWYAVHADVTRVAPISGRYTPIQRLLIDIILDAQCVVTSLAAPGVSIHDLNTACWNHINIRVDHELIKKGGRFNRSYDRAPHNVSHLLGHQVHDGDPSRDYRTRPLQAGNIISNEPGIYGEFEVTLGGIRYHETIGIRIEDNLLITPAGSENLTSTIKDPDAIAEFILAH